MAVALTLGLIAWIEGRAYGVDDLLAARRRRARPRPRRRRRARRRRLVGVRAAARSRSTPSCRSRRSRPRRSRSGRRRVGGSGFLAVYVVGLFVGNTPSPLPAPARRVPPGARVPRPGRAVRRPRPARLPERARRGRPARDRARRPAVLVVRPVAVWVSTAFSDFTNRERLLLGWAGLAAPCRSCSRPSPSRRSVIERDTIFNAVFFVVARLGARPGHDARVGRAAARAALAGAAPCAQPPLEVGRARARSSCSSTPSRRDHAIAGAAVRELGLPRSALVAVVARGDESIPPRGSTRVEPGDRLFVLAPRSTRATRSRHSSPLAAAGLAQASGASPRAAAGGARAGRRGARARPTPRA